MEKYSYNSENWWVVRYYITGNYGSPADTCQVDKPLGRPPMFIMGTYKNGYVGMYMPMALYPREQDLPSRRREIVLYPMLRRNPER